MRFTGERFIPGAWDVEPTFQRKMWQEHLARYLFGEALVKGKDVLDAGCGVGYGTDILGSGGARTVIGVDIAEAAIRYARDHYARPGVTFTAADVTSLPFRDGTFDVVVTFECIEHLHDPGALVREAKRVLKDHGVAVISTPRRRGASRSQFHTREFDPDEFETLLQSVFGSVILFGENNCLVTFVGREPRWAPPSRVEFVNEIRVRESDYVIAVCGQPHAIPGPVAVVNSDEYLLHLEHRVAALQDAARQRDELMLYPVRVWGMYRKLGMRGLVRRAALFLLVRMRLARYSPPGAPDALDHALAVVRAHGAPGLWRASRRYLHRAQMARRLLRSRGHSDLAGPASAPLSRPLVPAACRQGAGCGPAPQETTGHGTLRGRGVSSPRPRLRVGWFIPPPVAGSGGHRNIFRAVRHLVAAGHEVSLYVDGYDQQPVGKIERLVADELPDVDLRTIAGSDGVAPADVFFATHWRTVETVVRHRDKASCLLYFVQDFEPYFHPMSYEYIRAERTYRAGLPIITSGPWCARVLRERYGVEAEWFAFPVDQQVYYPRPDVPRERNLVAYFARPEMPRRLFPLGVDALRMLKARRPEVEVVLFGSDAVPDLAFEHMDLGVVRDLTALARLYSAATVGLTFSTTNPSLIPYELMACECPVVDVDYADNDVNYGTRENVMLAPVTPEGVAATIERLLDNEELRTTVGRNGREFVRSFPDAGKVGRIIERFMLRHWAAVCGRSVAAAADDESISRRDRQGRLTGRDTP